MWTQESFPIEIRASIQGFINGFSRVLWPVRAHHPGSGASETIQTTMWCFFGIVIIEGIAGTIMIRAQKKYGTDEERQAHKIAA